MYCATMGPAMHPANHKTIFVLDHTPYFSLNCESQIEFDFTKSRGPGYIPLAPISKSLWTCSVESAIEYCRIVWDLFPTGKLIRFIVSDDKAHHLNTWTPIQQSLNHMLNGLSVVGVPPPRHVGGDFSIQHGLEAAVLAMTECSDQQHEKRTAILSSENTASVVNRGRIICITSIPDIQNIRLLEQRMQEKIVHANKVALASDMLIQIDEIELVILNIQPSLTENIRFHKVSEVLSAETHHVKASGGLANKLTSLLLSHYDLVSTTVTGIPMKEEQNASSSANYDVEIFHSAKAHDTLFKGCGVDMSSLQTEKEGFEYTTVTLKWCTPRGCTAAEMHNCTDMHRITPVDVNSRPSSCLINFLVGGRSVMLEVSRRGPLPKSMSHLLAAHGGQIYMHSLFLGRSLHGDPPSISEGTGGRVTDYRITDFGQFMRDNQLVPFKGSKSVGNTLKRARPRLARHTNYWPMTISSTIIFNYKQYLSPLLELMLLPELRETEVQMCKHCIYNVIALESNPEFSSSSNSGSQKSKGGPKSTIPHISREQFKQLWAELESFMRAHCLSDKHINVLNCFLEARSKDGSESEKVELDQALRELDQLGSSPAPSKVVERASVIRATTDSPLSPDCQASYPVPKPEKSMLELWVERFSRQKPRPDFAGLATAEALPFGQLKATLYPFFRERKSFTKPPRPSVME